MALTPKRIYGPNQTAGLLITTTGKGNINQDGTEAYARLVALVDADGAIVPNGSSFVNITTATTTAVKASPGVLKGISINTGGAGSSVVIYNNTAGSGAKIGTFSTATQGVITLNAAASVGITAVTSGGTPADITIYYV